MSQLTTHILDISRGRPAEGINVQLFQQQDSNWLVITSGSTNKDGRIPHLLASDVVLETGVYKLRFEIKDYFDKQDLACFYPFAEISFIVSGNEHYHVPLLLSPFGFSTYRGS